MLLKKKKKYDINNLIFKLNVKNTYKNFFLFMMGMVLSAVAVSVFYSSFDFAVGGRTGLAIIINNYLNIDLSLVIFAISAILLVISFFVFGMEYGSKNILGTILYPIFLKAATLFNYFVDFKEVSPFLVIVSGAILSGIGFGLIKKSGYNSGGFRVLYDIINQKFKISIGNAIILCNVFIMILNLCTFGIGKFIYGVVEVYVSSVVADRVMLGISRNKAFYIITKKPLVIKEYIANKLDKSVTIVNAKGGYSNKKKKMLLCVIPTTEYSLLKEVVKEIDDEAFFLITDSYTVSKI